MKSKSIVIAICGLLFCAMINIQSTMAQVGPVVKISETQLSVPDAVLSFLGTHFPEATMAKVELEVPENYYEIKLSDGYEIDITPEGEWKKIDAPQDTAIPESILAQLIPSTIISHLREKKMLANVEEISHCLKSGYYEIDIFKGQDLWFDAEGRPIKKPNKQNCEK